MPYGEGVYGNLDGDEQLKSELVSVEKLEWYNATNVELIKRQYTVSWRLRQTVCFIYVRCWSSLK